MALLEALRIVKRFGGLTALNGLDVSLNHGMIAGLIGPNGAGKTTFFNMLTGLYRPTSGRLLLDGRNITGLRPNRVTRLGISRTFQTIRLFDNMTVLDNVLVGMNCRLRASWLGAIVRPPWVRHEERRARQRAQELLDYVGLLDRAEERAKKHEVLADQRAGACLLHRPAADPEHRPLADTVHEPIPDLTRLQPAADEGGAVGFIERHEMPEVIQPIGPEQQSLRADRRCFRPGLQHPTASSAVP